jgi:hypothetical protein
MKKNTDRYRISKMEIFFTVTSEFNNSFVTRSVIQINSLHTSCLVFHKLSEYQFILEQA